MIKSSSTLYKTRCTTHLVSDFNATVHSELNHRVHTWMMPRGKVYMSRWRHVKRTYWYVLKN